MMTIEEAEANIGAAVVYRARPHATPEAGTISSINERYVFVRFAAAHNTRGYVAATTPERLELAQ